MVRHDDGTFAGARWRFDCKLSLDKSSINLFVGTLDLGPIFLAEMTPEDFAALEAAVGSARREVVRLFVDLAQR
jgi:hypothetical protein